MFGSFATIIALAAAALLTVSGPLGPLSLRSDVPQHPESSWDQSHQGSHASMTMFENVKTQECLEAESNGRVFTRRCNKSYNQVWEQYGGSFLRHVVTKMCLTMSWEAQIYTDICKGSKGLKYQKWNVSSEFIQNVNTQMCIDDKVTAVRCFQQPSIRWKHHL